MELSLWTTRVSPTCGNRRIPFRSAIMQNRIILFVLALACLALLSPASAQDRGFGRPSTETQPDKDVIPGPGWKTCPRCTNPKQLAAAYKTYKVDGHPFDPHDLSGVWGNNGLELDVKNVPPFTPLGEKMFEATRSEIPTTNSKDGMLICDPLGYPRLFAYNYGFQFVMLPDRVLQFFEWGPHGATSGSTVESFPTILRSRVGWDTRSGNGKEIHS